MDTIDDFIAIEKKMSRGATEPERIILKGNLILGRRVIESAREAYNGKYLHFDYSPKFQAIRISLVDSISDGFRFETSTVGTASLSSPPVMFKKAQVPHGEYWPLEGHPNVYQYKKSSKKGSV